MPAINIVDKFQAIQYTGSNSGEIDSLITNFTVLSESGGILEFASGISTFTVNTGDWIRYSQNFVNSTHSASFQDFAYLEVTVPADLEPLAEQLDAIGTPLLSAGVKECPLLVVGNTTVAVDIIPAMPDTSYTANAQLFASVAVLADLTITNVTVVDTNTVNVQVTNGGVLSLTGANILVTVTA